MDYGNEKQIKRAKSQNEKDEYVNVFDKLPYEIATNTLCRLPITSLVQLSYSCRSLNSLSHNPDFVSLHLSKSSTNDSECLILHSNYPLRNMVHFFRFSDKKARKFNIPVDMSMPEFCILGSSNGLLCIVNLLFPDTLCLYNPFRRGHFEIPKNSVFKDKSVVYGFGFDPITNDYKVIMIAYHTYPYARNMGYSFCPSGPDSDVHIYSVNSNAWQNKGTVPYSLENWSKRGVLVSGRLHWISRWVKLNGRVQRTIVTYNLSDDAFDVIYGPDALRMWVPSHLSNLEGCLSVIGHAGGRGEAYYVWILREYGVCESWVKAYTIGTYFGVPRAMGEIYLFGRVIKSVVCVLKSGELLLHYRGRADNLITYNPRNMTFQSLSEYFRIPETPYDDALFHVGGLTSAAFPLS